MNARRLGARKAAVWFVGAMLAIFAAMLLGGCRERKGFARHEPNLYVARHGGHERIVLVEHERGSDRRHRQEARHGRRDRRDGRRTDRRDDDRPRARRR